MKKFLLIILFLIISTSVQAASWVKIDDKVYIDKDSVLDYVDEYGQTYRKQKIFWTKELNNKSTLFKEFEKENNVKIWYVMIQRIVNFNNKTITVNAVSYYDLKGNVVYSYTIPKYRLRWDSVVPDTYGDFLYTCVSNEEILKKMYDYQNSTKNE